MSTKVTPRPKATPAKSTKAAPKRQPVRNTKPAPAKRAPAAKRAARPVDMAKVLDKVGESLAGLRLDASGDITPPEFLPDANPQPDLTVALIAAMSHEGRVELARGERARLVAAKAKGETVPTPVLDWMLDPTSLEQTRPRSSGRVTVERDPEITEAIKTAIVEARTAGKTWQGVCNELTKRNLPTARGGRWYYSTARAVAVQLGVVDTPTTAKD